VCYHEHTLPATLDVVDTAQHHAAQALHHQLADLGRAAVGHDVLEGLEELLLKLVVGQLVLYTGVTVVL
jgi:hypothetical protein